MFFSRISLALYALIATSVALGSPSKPGCVSKCWDNSQYVSQCAGEVKCLCEDSEFQNAVYQCLYSQCQTAQFGSALHHTISFCQEEKVHAKEGQEVKEQVKPTVPALIRQQHQPHKRQQHNMGSVTRSVTQSVTRSVTRRPMSMSASQYMSYSTSRAYPTPVSQISDGQVQAPSPVPATQIADGQVQAPTPTAAEPVVQMKAGAPAPTALAALKRAFYDNRAQGHEI